MTLRTLVAVLLALSAVAPGNARSTGRPVADAGALPDWLPPPEPLLRIDSLAEARGLRFALDGHDGREHVFFIQDWRWVRLTDGRVVAARMELVDEFGDVSIVDGSSDPVFEGAVELTSFSEMMGVDVVTATDENGIIRHVAKAAHVRNWGDPATSPGELIIGKGACWMKPDFGCPLLTSECPSWVGCLPQPNGRCACVIGAEAGRISYCLPEVIGHTCTNSSRCSGQCVEPCLCVAPGDDEEEE